MSEGVDPARPGKRDRRAHGRERPERAGDRTGRPLHAPLRPHPDRTANPRHPDEPGPVLDLEVPAHEDDPVESHATGQPE